MNNLIKLAKNINEELLKRPLVKQYRELEEIVGEQIKADELNIRRLQRMMAESLGEEGYEDIRNQYLKAKFDFEENPIYQNFLALKSDLNDLLNLLNEFIKQGI